MDETFLWDTEATYEHLQRLREDGFTVMQVLSLDSALEVKNLVHQFEQQGRGVSNGYQIRIPDIGVHHPLFGELLADIQAPPAAAPLRAARGALRVQGAGAGGGAGLPRAADAVRDVVLQYAAAAHGPSRTGLARGLPLPRHPGRPLARPAPRPAGAPQAHAARPPPPAPPPAHVCSSP